MLIIRMILHDILLDKPSTLLVYTITIHTRFENLMCSHPKEDKVMIHQKTTGEQGLLHNLITIATSRDEFCLMQSKH